MSNYEGMTNGDFERLLIQRLNDMNGAQLLDIPGIYEILSEHFNNEVLDDWMAEQETLQDLEG